MKKCLITSTIYCGLGLITGVLFRELTKMANFEGRTALGMVHAHFIGLGFMFFLLLMLFAPKIEKYKPYKVFFVLYNVGMGLTGLAMLVRGIAEVQKMDLSKELGKICIPICGGIGHMILTASLVLLFICLFKMVKGKEEK